MRGGQEVSLRLRALKEKGFNSEGGKAGRVREGLAIYEFGAGWGQGVSGKPVTGIRTKVFPLPG